MRTLQGRKTHTFLHPHDLLFSILCHFGCWNGQTFEVKMTKLLRSKWPNFWGQNDQTIHSIGPIHYSTHYHYSYSSYVHISSSSGCSLDVVMTKLLILLDPFTIQHITIIHIHHTFISPHLAAVLDSFITSFRTILGTSGRIYRLS